MDKTNKFVIKTIEAFEKTALKEMDSICNTCCWYSLNNYLGNEREKD